MSKTLFFPRSKKYSVIYADPSWQYRDKAIAGNRGAESKYSVMSMDDIADLPVENISADDCFLFLWVTFPMLEDLFLNGLVRCWGFEYKTVAFVWVKKAKHVKDGWHWGMGNYIRANPEICLLCTKGNPKRVSASVHSVVDSPVEEHSRKPDEVRKRIVQLCGDVPRIELFARERVSGWDSWGFEVPIPCYNREGLIASRRNLRGI